MGSLLTLCIDLLTELVPATSFAMEKAESNIMQLPPRSIKTDKLTSYKLLFYSYFQAGMILTGACYLAYFGIFNHYGVTAFDLFVNNNKFFPASKEDAVFVTTDGRSYDAGAQKIILYRIQAAWYIMIVIGQVSHLFNARTRLVSIFEHGLFVNQTANFGIIIALFLGLMVIYCPGIVDIVEARDPLSLEIFYAALLGAGMMWGYCEGRKWFSRNFPSHWSNKYLAW